MNPSDFSEPPKAEPPPAKPRQTGLRALVITLVVCGVLFVAVIGYVAYSQYQTNQKIEQILDSVRGDRK